MNDWELLNQFAREGSQDAFASIVSRHVNLVYTAARRQVATPTLAEEVAQSVFIELARCAPRLKPTSSLASWLHTVTRHAAIKAARAETRRRVREQTAFELSVMNSNSTEWKQVEPMLDEAVAALSEADRSAILLRYFENRTLREIGVMLGASEDAAQKRVSRALDQLRTFFLKRGVAVGSAALATELSAHAVQAAPAALGATISVGSTLSVLGGTGVSLAVETTKTIAMTTLQKTALAAVLAFAIGAGVYEAGVLYRQRQELELARDAASRWQVQIAALRQEQNASTRELVSLREQIAKARTPSPLDLEMTEALRAWQGRERLLKQTLADNPQWDIPELQLLVPEDWTTATETADVSSPENIRKVLATLRSKAERVFAGFAAEAIKAYAAANDGLLPENPRQLALHLSSAVEASILGRYQLVRTGKLYVQTDANGTQSSDTVMISKEVDPEVDSAIMIGVSSDATRSLREGSGGGSTLWLTLAMEAYGRANPGQGVGSNVALLLNYFPPATPAAVLDEFKSRFGTQQ